MSLFSFHSRLLICFGSEFPSYRSTWTTPCHCHHKPRWLCGLSRCLVINCDRHDRKTSLIMRCWLCHHVDSGEGEIAGEPIGPRTPISWLTYVHSARYLTVLNLRFFNDTYSRIISSPCWVMPSSRPTQVWPFSTTPRIRKDMQHRTIQLPSILTSWSLSMERSSVLVLSSAVGSLFTVLT